MARDIITTRRFHISLSLLSLLCSPKPPSNSPILYAGLSSEDFQVGAATAHGRSSTVMMQHYAAASQLPGFVSFEKHGFELPAMALSPAHHGFLSGIYRKARQRGILRHELL